MHNSQLNSTHSLTRKDLTGHTGPNGHLHMPIIKLEKNALLHVIYSLCNLIKFD